MAAAVIDLYALEKMLHNMRHVQRGELTALLKSHAKQNAVVIKRIQASCIHLLDITCYRTNGTIDGRRCSKCKKYFKE
jgi:hypothetical protein